MITYAPYTVASLHATFTGMYGRQNGVDAYTKSSQFESDACYTLPQYLHDIGYYTHGYTFTPIVLPHNGFDKLQVVAEDQEKDVLASHLRELDFCFNQSRRFFSFLHYGEIHHAVVREVLRKYDDFSEEYFEHHDRNRIRYVEFARQAGGYLEEIVKRIDEKDPDGNTLIVVFTDHGSSLGEKPGEKAYGIFTYDYSVCVWAYFIWPKRLPTDCQIPCQVRSIDILPTLTDLLGIPHRKKRKPMMGRSLLPLIQGTETHHRLAFSETGGVDGPYPSPNAPNICSVRDGKWKLIYNRDINKFELYNLGEDPAETNNLYMSLPDKSAELWVQMVQYL